MMKIMTAMYTMKRGGSYNRFVMMSDAFLEKGWEVYCLSLTPIRVQNAHFYNHVLLYPFRNKESLMAKLTVFFFFPIWSVWIGCRHKINLIVAFGLLYAFLLGFSKWLLRIPMVTFVRGNYSFALRMQNPSRLLLLLNKMIEFCGLLLSNEIITNNYGARNEILKTFRKARNADIRVLYNNIPPMPIQEKQDILQTRGKYGIPENAKVVVTAGVLNRGKNIGTLIKCIPKIGVKDIYVLIAGEGSTKDDLQYKNFVKELARKLDVANHVIFTGWLEKEELWNIYDASDLFVLPSLKEGMPNALLEALGSGLPCIASNIPGNRDILQYEELMFDPLDEKAIMEKIQLTFSDSKFFNKIQELCRERKRVFVFNWKDRMFQTVTTGFDGACQRA